MRRSNRWIGLAVVLLLVVTVAAVAQGRPGRNNQGRSQPQSGTCCWQCQTLDLETTRTVIGTVTDFTGGPGVGTPTVSLDAPGEELAIVIGPYRLWAASGLTIEAGRELEVTFATCLQTAKLVAIQVKDLETGAVVQLRDPKTGKPLAGPWSGRR